MKLSTRVRYATRLMLALARSYEHGYVQLRDIAAQEEVSLKYLEQIIMPLNRKRYVSSIRGPGGGYRLSKPPVEITVGEIVVLMEAGSAMMECSTNPQSCRRAGACVTRELWQEAAEAFFERLNRVTLSDLLQREKNLAIGDLARAGHPKGQRDRARSKKGIENEPRRVPSPRR